METLALPLLVGLIGIALLFDFLNGLHDAANSIATIVSTRVLRPQYAVFWAAFFNFIAFLFFGLHVATTLGKGIIDPSIVTPHVVFAALMGAIIWNVITWLGGIPSSSSHALIGGLLGAGIAKAGTSAVVIAGVLKTVGGPMPGGQAACSGGGWRVMVHSSSSGGGPPSGWSPTPTTILALTFGGGLGKVVTLSTGCTSTMMTVPSPSS